MPAKDMLNMLDIVKMNGSDRIVGLVEDAISVSAEMKTFPMRPIEGTSFRTLFRTGYPESGFTGANGGVKIGKSKLESKLTQTFVYKGLVAIAKEIAAADDQGEAHARMVEALGMTEGALINIGAQIWYGLEKNGKGFPGAKSFTPFGGKTQKGDLLTIDAEGSTASTASSVYLVRFGPQACELVGGMNRAMDLSEWRVESIKVSDDEFLPSHVADLVGWIGLSIQSEDSVRRIANLTEQEGKGLTDKLLSKAWAQFPQGRKPHAIYASRRSIEQLQAYRAAKVSLQGDAKRGTLGGSDAYVPWPTDFQNVPIYESDSIGNKDAIES